MKPINNIVCQVLNPEHGAKVIEAFKALGVDTAFDGSAVGSYYGTIDGKFKSTSFLTGLTEFTLEQLQAMAQPKLTFPREMMVWDEGGADEPKKRTVIAFFDKCYHAIADETAISSTYGCYSVVKWQYASEIPAKKQHTQKELEAIVGYEFEIVKEK